MKKQILILAMLTLALLFSATNMSFGQPLNPENDYLDAVPTCPAAIPLTCATGTGLNPVPGVEYPYTITAPDAGTVYWFVTDDPTQIMTAPSTFTANIDPGDGTGDYLLDSDAAYNVLANTSLTVNLTWKSFNGTANQVLLVAYVVNASGCTDNIEVFRIVPTYSFTLDIAGLDETGVVGTTECVGNIQSASYDGTDLNVVYGDNYVFFIVTAANWQTSWMPSWTTANSTLGASTITSVEWAYADEATNTGAWNAVTDPVLASHYTTIVNNGFISEACIVVRVEVSHAATETLATESIVLGINGNMEDPETAGSYTLYPDLDEGPAGQPCVNNVTDEATYTITPRPTMTAVTPTPFENKLP
ncbi:hypothetical protein TBC1_121071 [Lentimicrobium saccharophilum]|uniref:Uncharacterized protein n=1 Tax=Lentimicrobium saccharophilum TaxID=1678841 RepID=A0A0S7C3K6_9BACT|nr:hypothetical protein [Lentimicrobium saccharophilum]GAP45250.1 hypothetical protein TBC1_121071 [Lentimicrobium saccharophilum]